MEKEQFKTLVKGMKAVYSDPKFISDKDAFDVWYSLLKDLEYKYASLAIQKYMMLNKFPPTIADIRAEYITVAYPQELGELQAWELVINSLAEVETSGAAKKKFDAFPELIKKAIGGYAQFLDLVDKPNVRQMAKSNFAKFYAKLLEEDSEMKRLQPEIRKIMESNRFSVIEQGTLTQIEKGEDEELIGDEWADL